jgi:two-component system OmpR family sensor kinase
LNKNEKKALFSFLTIYVGSSVFFLAMSLYIYYNKELKTVDKQCSMEMVSVAHQLRGDILKAYSNGTSYIPQELSNKLLKFGLVDYDNKIVYSQLSNNDTQFNGALYEANKDIFHILELKKKEIPIKYIIMETKQGILDKIELENMIWFIIIIGAIIITFVGYLLSNLLLRPVREKISHMDRFIKDSAHELNTPIAVLRTSVSMLNKGKNEEKMLRYINSSTKQISEAYNDLHFAVFDDIQDSMNVSFDLKELCQESIDFFEDIALVKKVNIEFDIDNLNVFMDRNKAQKIVNNLISNAIKYSKKGGIINISLKNAIFTVRDHGIGISQEEQKLIFNRYERGTNTEGGLGIGLDIVNTISKEYNISVKLESKLNSGSTFTLNLNEVREA